MMQTYHYTSINEISLVFVAEEHLLLIGFPNIPIVQQLVDSTQEFYQEKNKATINLFTLFPKPLTMKHQPKLTNDHYEQLMKIADIFQFEEEQKQHLTSRKKRIKQGETNLKLVRRNPVMKFYQSNQNVLKEDYTYLAPEAWKHINKQQQARIRQRIKQWINIGFHYHILQCLKYQVQLGRLVCAIEKTTVKTLRDWMALNFLKDKSQKVNTKRIINILIQCSVGIHYIHTKSLIHQNIRPQSFYIQKQKIIKLGNLYQCSGAEESITKNRFAGASPQYWSIEMGGMYESIKQMSKDINSYRNAVQLLPSLTQKSDVYQFGLLIIELLYDRFWVRGDRISLSQLQDKENDCIQQQVVQYLHQISLLCIRFKPEERPQMAELVTNILSLYQQIFNSPEDLLWVRYFNQDIYQSQILNNKAVGYWLSGNELEAQKYWARALIINPRNLIATFNFSHYRRMKRNIDDMRLNKQLLLQPEARKRNFYLLISNLTILPLIKEPLKTFNFNPRLCKGKQGDIIRKVLQEMQNRKKKEIYQRRYEMGRYNFQNYLFLNNIFFGRLQQQLTVICWNLKQSPKPYNYIQISAPLPQIRDLSVPLITIIDPSTTYMAMTYNDCLVVFKIDILQQSFIHYSIQALGSVIISLAFDASGNHLALSTTQFLIRIISLQLKQIVRQINIGQKFSINNLVFYDRNSCVGFSSEKSIMFFRIQQQKPTFSIKCSNIVVSYNLAQHSLTNHIMVVLTIDKFEIWNLKDKVLLRNIEIEQPQGIKSFVMAKNRRITIHYNTKVLRIWNYTNGLILKSFKSTSDIIWGSLTGDSKYLILYTKDRKGGMIHIKNIDFDDFIKGFDAICNPSQLCITDDRIQDSDEISKYLKIMTEIIQTIKEYRNSTLEKKNSLTKMYKLGQQIKTQIFFQDKQEPKQILKYLNSIRLAEKHSSKINSHSEQYIFASRKENYLISLAVVDDTRGMVAIAQQHGQIRLLNIAKQQAVYTWRPCYSKPLFLSFVNDIIIISYDNFQCQAFKLPSLHPIYSYLSKIPPLVLLKPSQSQFVIASHTQINLYSFLRQQIFSIKNVFDNVADGYVVDQHKLVLVSQQAIRVYAIIQNTLEKIYVHRNGAKWLLDSKRKFFTGNNNIIRYFDCHQSLEQCGYLKIETPQEVIHFDFPPNILVKPTVTNQEQGYLVVLLDSAQVVIYDIRKRDVKWRMQFVDELLKVWWWQYPHSIMVVSIVDVRVYNLYWRYYDKK